ncbi:MAG: LptE family protein [Rhodothermia bacterium]|nr:MAG: LptE family protein [Rhodothermia bacterium]
MHKASKDPSEKTIIGRGALIWVFVLLLPGCGYYSFSGATVPEHIGTIAIPQVKDNSVSTFAGLDEQMTQLLIQRFVRQTRLSLEPRDDDADALLRVEITRYVNAPTSVSGNERATRNRVTITVNVTYNDQVEDKPFISRTFSSFEEFDAFDPASEEEAAASTLRKIADDIFTAATSDW